MKKLLLVLFVSIFTIGSVFAFGNKEESDSFGIDYPEVNTTGTGFLSAYVDKEELPVELFPDMFDDLAAPAGKALWAYYDVDEDIEKLLTEEEIATFGTQVVKEEDGKRFAIVSYNGFVLDEETGWTFWGEAEVEQKIIGRIIAEVISFKGILKFADDCIFEVEAEYDPNYFNPIVMVNGEQLDVGENPFFFTPGKGVSVSDLLKSVGPQKFTSFN